MYNFSPAFRYWSNQISYIILCVLAWFLKPGVTDDTRESGVGIPNGALEKIVIVLILSHAASVCLRAPFLMIRVAMSLQSTRWRKSSEQVSQIRVLLESRGLVKEPRSCSSVFDSERDCLSISFHFYSEMTFTVVALMAVFTRGTQRSSEFADLYLYFMVLLWGRLVTILQVFRFSGRHFFLI